MAIKTLKRAQVISPTDYRGQLAALQPLLDSAGKTYDQTTQDANQAQLDAIDFPSLFAAAAKQANPNYGMSRADILAKYTDPKYTDPNSSEYIDPNAAISMATRLSSGYTGVINDASSRAGAIFNRDVTAKEQAQNSAASRLQGLRDQAEKASDRAFQIANRSSSGSSGNTITLKDALKNPGTLGLMSAGITKKQQQDGGFEFIDNATGKPISVQEVQTRIPGSSIQDFLKDSYNPQDVAVLNPPAPVKSDPYRQNLQAAMTAINSGAKKKDVRARLYAEYPDKRKEIDQAIR